MSLPPEQEGAPTEAHSPDGSSGSSPSLLFLTAKGTCPLRSLMFILDHTSGTWHPGILPAESPDPVPQKESGPYCQCAHSGLRGGPGRPCGGVASRTVCSRACERPPQCDVGPDVGGQGSYTVNYWLVTSSLQVTTFQHRTQSSPRMIKSNLAFQGTSKIYFSK